MATASTVPTLEWSDFLRRFDWRQGEHVSLIGPTGGGKTTLAVQLLERRGYVVAIGTKPKDKTLNYLRRHQGYKLVRELPGQVQPGRPSRVIVWPKMSTLDRAKKRELATHVRTTLDRAYSAGGWTIFADELSFLSNTLKLAPELSDIWQQGRSNHVSLIGCSQRPRHIPLDAYSAASHLFLWRNNDEYDLKRLSGLNGVSSALVRSIVPQLPRFAVLYVSTRTGAMAITVPPKVN
jgi:ABC-type cobalamin/Fe3+-siderophores transport system ATPase subunit